VSLTAFEAVDVEQEQRHLASVSRGSSEHLRQALAK